MLADFLDRFVEHLLQLLVAGLRAQLADHFDHLAVGAVIVLKLVDVEFLQVVDRHRSSPF
jgi:hypothetical protein